MNGKLLRRAGGALAITLLSGLLWSSAAQATTATFNYTGGEQTFTVPAGVTSLNIVAVGAQGGLGANDPYAAAFGAAVAADVPVTPGTPLYIEVGGIGGNGVAGAAGAGGFNGGGSGGTGDATIG